MRNPTRSLLAATAILVVLAVAPAGAQDRAAFPQRNLWAVVIGVEKYDDPRIPPATGAVADSRAISDWLRASLPEGWALRGLFHAFDGGEADLANPTGEAIRAQPTRSNLTTRLNQWLQDRIPPGGDRPRPGDSRDVVLIYFAGQAIGLPPEPGKFPEIERHFLLPRDAQPDNWSETGLAIDDLLAPSPDSPLRDCVVICWLDTSLQGRGQTPAVWPRNFQPDSRLFLTRLVAWPGRSVWLAASGRPSGLTADGKRGLFTDALLGALGKPGKSDMESGDLLSTLDRLRGNRSLDDQGFLVKGALPPGLSPRQGGLGPLPQVQDQMVLQQGHSQAVRHFALSADGETLITGSDDSTIRLWKLGTREVYRTYADQFNGVGAIALASGGRYLLGGDGVGNVRGYNLAKLTSLSLASKEFQHVNGIARIVRLPGQAPEFLSLDQINAEGDGTPTGGRLLRWRIKNDDVMEAQPFFLGKNTPRIARIAVLDDPEAKVCLVTLDDRGRLQGHDAQRRPVGPAHPVGQAIDVAGIALAPGGDQAVVLTDQGRLQRIDLAGDRPPVVVELGVPVKADGLLAGPNGLMAVLTLDDKALIVPIDRPDDRRVVPAKVVEAAWSETGRWLATAGPQGPPRLWRIDPRGGPTEVQIDLPNDDPSILKTRTAGLAIARDRLIAGDGLGGVRTWALPGPGAAEGGRADLQQALGPSRGRVQRVRADRTGNRLVAQTTDGSCWIWDLKTHDGPRTLTSRIHGVEVLGDGRGVAVCREGDRQGHGGRIELLDWQGKDLGVALALPPNPGELGINDVAASPDGRWVAGLLKGNLVSPQVVLWDLRAADPGRPAATIDDHPAAVTRAAFSADSQWIVTVDEGGNAFVRNLANPAALAPPGARFEFGKRDVAAGELGKIEHEVHLTAAAFHPDDPSRLVVGTSRGELIACQTAAAIQDRQFHWLGAGRERRATTDLAFVQGPNGDQWLGASFSDVSLRLWKVDQDGFRNETLPASWRHAEQVNSLAAWPVSDAPMFISGGDDGAICFWGVEAPGEPSKRLIGSLAVWPRESAPTRDWIAYTPGGEFDGTPGGVQFLRRIGSRVQTLDQQDLESARVQDLVGLFAAGKVPGPRPPIATLPPPPVLSVAALSRPNARNAYLRIRYEPDVSDLRLYQNNVPVPISGADERLIDQPDRSGQITARVVLRPGLNEFHAMASSTRPGALEGRSDPIEVRSEISEEEPSLHVLALGVGNYARRKLRFATKDAADLAGRLRELVQAGDQPLGLVNVLLDEEVTERNLRKWFIDVRQAVRDRPQDKVVVYLAGHTEVTEKGRRFALLPVNYEFTDDWPEVVASRGLDSRPIPANLEPKVLTYALILSQLVNVEARERLVIIDACQAEAIFSDPAVAQIRRVVDLESWKGRIAYLLATRRGEAALEEKTLEHGLMTYLLLRGTGGLVKRPAEADPIFADGESADLNGDRVVTVPELQEFVRRKLPLLVEQFGGDRERGGSPGGGANPIVKPRPESRLPVDEFPLIRLPAPGPGRP